MLIQIKCRFSRKVMFEHDAEENSIKITIEAGIKSGASLAGANLAGASLAGANLAGANLFCANLARASLAGANLDGANLAGANLARASLAGASLAGANLGGAYLDGASLDGTTYGFGVEIGKNPIFITGLTWPVYIFKSHIKIGCQIHSKEDWLSFCDDSIGEMEERALEFWTKWKKHILWMAFEGGE